MFKQMLRVCGLCIGLVSIQQAHASTLRIACDDSAAGGEVTVNGKFKGECPIDVQAPGGSIKLKVVKSIGGKPQVYEQTIRIGDDVIKRIDVSFGGSAPASAVAPAMIDPQMLDRQRYEMEMTQYQNSIKACLPKYSAELRKAKAAVREEQRRLYRACYANLSEGQREHPEIMCGPQDYNFDDQTIAREIDTVHSQELSDWVTISGQSPEEWCAGQFTKPKPPAR